MLALHAVTMLVGHDGLERCGARYVLMTDALCTKSDCDQAEAIKYAGWVRLERATTAPGPWIVDWV